VQGTSDHLHFEPRLGEAAAVSVRMSDRDSIELAAVDGRLPVTLVGDGLRAHGRAVRVVPASLSIVRQLDRAGAIVPYVGAGVMLPVVRRAVDVAAIPSLHVGRVEQPDHGALVLQSGARVSFGERWWLGVDAKYLPAASTFETRTRENTSDALQTNVHPLVVATGVGVRF